MDIQKFLEDVAFNEKLDSLQSREAAPHIVDLIEDHFKFDSLSPGDKVEFLDKLEKAQTEMMRNIYFEVNQFFNADGDEITYQMYQDAKELLSCQQSDLSLIMTLNDRKKRNRGFSAQEQEEAASLEAELRNRSSEVSVNLVDAYRLGQAEVLGKASEEKEKAIRKVDTFRLARRQTFTNINFYIDNLYMQSLGIHDPVKNVNMSISVSGNQDKAANLINRNRDYVFGSRDWCISRNGKSKKQYESEIEDRLLKAYELEEELEGSQERVAELSAVRASAAKLKSFFESFNTTFASYYEEITYMYTNVLKETLESNATEESINELKKMINQFFDGRRKKIDAAYIEKYGENILDVYSRYKKLNKPTILSIKSFFQSLLSLPDPSSVYDRLSANLFKTAYADAHTALNRERLNAILVASESYNQALENNNQNIIIKRQINNARDIVNKEVLRQRLDQNEYHSATIKTSYYKEEEEEDKKKKEDTSVTIKKEKLVRRKNFEDLLYFNRPELEAYRKNLKNMIAAIESDDYTNPYVETHLTTLSYQMLNGKYKIIDLGYLTENKEEVLDIAFAKLEKVNKILSSAIMISNVTLDSEYEETINATYNIRGLSRKATQIKDARRGIEEELPIFVSEELTKNINAVSSKAEAIKIKLGKPKDSQLTISDLENFLTSDFDFDLEDISELSRKADEEFREAKEALEAKKREIRNITSLAKLKEEELKYFYDPDVVFTDDESINIIETLSREDFRNQYQEFHPEEVRMYIKDFGVPAKAINDIEAGSAIVGYGELKKKITAYTYSVAAEWYGKIRTAVIEENKLDIGDARRILNEKEKELFGTSYLDPESSTQDEASLNRLIGALTDSMAAIRSGNFENIPDSVQSEMNIMPILLDTYGEEEIQTLVMQIAARIQKLKTREVTAVRDEKDIFNALIDLVKNENYKNFTRNKMQEILDANTSELLPSKDTSGDPEYELINQSGTLEYKIYNLLDRKKSIENKIEELEKKQKQALEFSANQTIDATNVKSTTSASLNYRYDNWKEFYKGVTNKDSIPEVSTIVKPFEKSWMDDENEELRKAYEKDLAVSSRLISIYEKDLVSLEKVKNSYNVNDLRFLSSEFYQIEGVGYPEAGEFAGIFSSLSNENKKSFIEEKIRIVQEEIEKISMTANVRKIKDSEIEETLQNIAAKIAEEKADIVLIEQEIQEFKEENAEIAEKYINLTNVENSIREQTQSRKLIYARIQKFFKRIKEDKPKRDMIRVSTDLIRAIIFLTKGFKLNVFDKLDSAEYNTSRSEYKALKSSKRFTTLEGGFARIEREIYNSYKRLGGLQAPRGARVNNQLAFDRKTTTTKISYRDFMQKLVTMCSLNSQTRIESLSSLRNPTLEIQLNLENEVALREGMNILLSVLGKFGNYKITKGLNELIRDETYGGWKAKASGTNNLMASIWMSRIMSMKRRIKKLLAKGLIHDKTGTRSFTNADGDLVIQPIEIRDLGPEMSNLENKYGESPTVTYSGGRSPTAINYRLGEQASFATQRRRCLEFHKARRQGRRSVR